MTNRFKLMQHNGGRNVIVWDTTTNKAATRTLENGRTALVFNRHKDERSVAEGRELVALLNACIGG